MSLVKIVLKQILGGNIALNLLVDFLFLFLNYIHLARLLNEATSNYSLV